MHPMPAAASIQERFRAVLDLYDTSVEIMRLNLRRRLPQATAEEITTALRRWLAKADECEPTPWTIRKPPAR